MDPTYSDICETKLITIVSILHAIQQQPLFDGREQDIQLEITCTGPADKHNLEVSFTGCPDCIISLFPHQTNNAVNVGYGEMKKIVYGRRPLFVQFAIIQAL